jgi:hypothetical protein
LEGAPGWRVIERPKRRSRAAGYVIASLGACAALFLVAVAIHGYWSGRLGPDLGRWTADRAGRAPDAGPSPGPLARPEAKPADRTDRAGSEQATPSIERPASAPARVRIFIHHTAGTANAMATIQLAAFLQVRGFNVAEIRSVEAQIERPSVRYFFDRDQPGSQRLVEAISGFFAKDPDLAPERATDLTDIASKPPEGDVEVWLRSPGTG